MGVQYQAHPRDDDSQIIIHVRMLERENRLQQEALGIVGVNLLYAAFFLHHKPQLMVESLLDNLNTDRVEIDMIEFSGIEFRHVDNRVMSLKLVQLGLTGAAMFGPAGEVLQPSEVLRKRPVLVERGSFRPVTKVSIDMIDSAHERFAAESEVEANQIVELMEITMRNLLAAGTIDLGDFLARADVLAAAGKTVLISEYFEYYRLAAYLTRYTSEPIAVTMGAASLKELFTEQYCSTTRDSKAVFSRHSASCSPRIYGSMFIHCGTKLPACSPRWKISRCPPICAVCIVIWWSVGESSNSTISMKACCTSFRVMS
jgi:hypothetical protein